MVFKQIIGDDSIVQYNATNLTEAQLISALAAHDAVAASTTVGSGVVGLVAGHAYTVVGYNAATDTVPALQPMGSRPDPTAATLLSRSFRRSRATSTSTDASGTYPLERLAESGDRPGWDGCWRWTGGRPKRWLGGFNRLGLRLGYAAEHHRRLVA